MGHESRTQHEPHADRPEWSADDIQPRALPAWQDLVHAFALLLWLPAPRPTMRSAAYAKATLFFPLAGLVLGGLLLGADQLLQSLALPGAALGLVLLWAVAARDWSQGTKVWLTAAWAVKVGLLGMTGAVRPAALLFAPLLARWGIVVLLTGARDASQPDRKLNPLITFREFALTSVATGAVVCTLGNAVGVLLYVATGAMLLGLRAILHRWLGGVSESSVALAIQSVEIACLALLASAA